MSASNGVIRIGRKGIKKFAFGEDGPAFEVDIVAAFQQWIGIDDSFRPDADNEEGRRPVATGDMPAYHQAAVKFAAGLAGDKAQNINPAEALDFIARLREQYDELADFFHPKLRDERASPATSRGGSELQFSEEKEEV